MDMTNSRYVHEEVISSSKDGALTLPRSTHPVFDIKKGSHQVQGDSKLQVPHEISKKQMHSKQVSQGGQNFKDLGIQTQYVPHGSELSPYENQPGEPLKTFQNATNQINIFNQYDQVSLANSQSNPISAQIMNYDYNKELRISEGQLSSASKAKSANMGEDYYKQLYT